MYRIKEIPYSDVPQFSPRDLAYQSEDKRLRPFYQHRSLPESFENAIALRKTFPVNRKLLVDQLQLQYQNLNMGDAVQKNIGLLLNENSFTLVTAHQPSLLTGPLYFIYKIGSTLRLASRLANKYKNYHFIPCFILGGEDHDFEEIATMHLFGKDFSWQSEQKGATGRMKPDEGLKKVIEEIIGCFGTSNFSGETEELIRSALSKASSYGEFCLRLVHSLFRDYGLVIINMDNTAFKKEFLPVALDEIENKNSHHCVNQDQDALSSAGFKSQAHAREINLFLHTNSGRERIVEEGDGFTVGDKNYSRKDLLEKIKSDPACLSPNVILRPLYQEMILPNLCYIGGGGEIAYWLERKSLFNHYAVPFPILTRRDSVLIVDSKSAEFIEDCGLEIASLFQRPEHISATYAQLHASVDLDLKKHKEEISAVFSDLEEKAQNIDPTLGPTVAAERSKTIKSLDYLESKLMRSVKQKHEQRINKLLKLKQKFFPGNDGLQERYDNFIAFYLRYGPNWIKSVLEHLDPMNRSFKILIEDQAAEK